MSQKSEALEKAIETIAEGKCFGEIFESVDQKLVSFFKLSPDVKIIAAKKIGNQSHQNKTDVLLELSNQKKIKISIKLANADYFGNWYSHERAINEFGKEKIQKLITKTTEWANNNWLNSQNARLFVGVSISFGMRTGKTDLNFTEVFDKTDVMTIIRGAGEDNNDATANTIYIAQNEPTSFEELVKNLKLLDEKNVEKQIKNFKIIFRPVNPTTSDSDRGKNIYTRFKPKKVSKEIKIIDQLPDLKNLGKFEEIDLNTEENLTHNKALDELFLNYNILIPRKNYFHYYLNNNLLNVVYLDDNHQIIHEVFKSDSEEYKKITHNAFSTIKKRNYKVMIENQSHSKHIDERKDSHS